MRAAFFHPRYWGTWLLLAVLRLSVLLLPRRGRSALGTALGAVGWHLAREPRATTLRNLELCYPQLTPRERTALARETFRHLGLGVFEIATAWWATEQEIASLYEIIGREHLQAAQVAAQEEGRGVLLLSAHMIGLEISGAMLNQLIDFKALYREDRNPLIATVVRRARRRRIAGVISNRDMRAMLRALNHGETIWYAPDQNISPRRGGLFAPFFGIAAATTPAGARLAERTGCLVLPYYPKRLPDGRYQLIFEPPLEPFPAAGEDLEAATARVNALIEHWVRAQPEQYFWAHKRFKSRPPETPRRY
nr:lysophospholipid acyltransferase family protein [Halorhodospira abdelmalekii]